MHMINFLSQLESQHIIPVVMIDDASKGEKLAAALLQSRLAIIEITMRTPAAISAILAIQSMEGVIVGAGTVLSEMHFDQAVEAGAQFIVTPGTNIKVIQRAIKNQILIFPGVATATEIQTVLDEGLNIVKFFPAETSGGAVAIKALSGPFGDVKFIPTGGIGLDNLELYLKLPSVLAVGGSWMVPRDLLQTDNYVEIRKLSAEAFTLSESIRR